MKQTHTITASHDSYKQSPILNEYIAPPGKSLGFRFCSYLVLWSFFFQTLWPNVAFSMDGGVETQRAPSPHRFRIGSMGSLEKPSLSLEVLSDDEDDKASPSTPLFQKTFQPSDIKDELIPLMLTTLAVYAHLRVRAEGIEWFSQGLWMQATWKGELLVRGDFINSGSHTTSYQPITLENQINVSLGDGLNLDRLKIISPLIVNMGKNTRIKHLDAVGLSSPSLVVEGRSSLFLNMEGASLTIKDAVLNGICWQNKGFLTLEEGGKFDAEGNPIENMGMLSFEEGAKITKASDVLNLSMGSMTGTGNWYLEDIGLLRNEGIIGNETDTLHLKAEHLDNRHQLNLSSFMARLTNGGQNHGQILTTTKTDILCSTSWLNSEGALMKSHGQQTLGVVDNLTNRGSIVSKSQRVTVFQKLTNTGVIEGDSWSLTAIDLINEGSIGASDLLLLYVTKGCNCRKGEIASHKHMIVEILGIFGNCGKVTAQEALEMTIQGKLTNINTITSKTTLETNGDGELDNWGAFQGDIQTTIGHAETDNRGLMVEKGSVHLKPTKRFYNHVNDTSAGLVVAKDKLTVSGSGEIINDAGTDDHPGFGGKDIVFDGYKGTFTNNGRLIAEDQIRGAIAKIRNEGLVQAGHGYDLTIYHLMNKGIWQGQGHLTVGKGINGTGKIEGVGLIVTINEELINEIASSMRVQCLDGKGLFRNDNLLQGVGTQEQPMMIGVQTFQNNGVLEPGEAVTFTESVRTWLNGEKGKIEVDTVGFARADTLSTQTLNQGVLKAKLLSLERSMENEGDFTTTTLMAHASAIKNKQTANLRVLGLSTVTLDELTNEGLALFHQAVSGSIARIYNKTSIKDFVPTKPEDGRDRLEFMVLNALTGTSLTNEGLFLALQGLGWVGDHIYNDGVLVTQSSSLGFRHQFINKKLWRWAQGGVDVSVGHVLNLNTFEKTNALTSPYKALEGKDLPADKTTDFKAGTFENRGQWEGSSQKVTALHLLNTGAVSVGGVEFDVGHLLNKNHFNVSQGNATGRIGVFENDHDFSVLAGLLDIVGTNLTNKRQLWGQLGISYNGVTFINQHEVKTPEQLRLLLSGAATNAGLLSADGGFDWQVKTFNHQHGKMIGHAKSRKSTIVVTDKMTTGQEADCQLHAVDLTVKEWNHNGSLKLAGASSLKPEVFKHQGRIVGLEAVDSLLTLVTNDLQLQGVIAFYDINVTLRGVGKATSTREGQLISRNQLSLNDWWSYDHYGLFQARYLEYHAHSPACGFMNYGRVIGSERSFIEAHFVNKVGGAARLTGVTLYRYDQNMKNEGELILSKIQSLGATLMSITNAPKATLTIQDCGHRDSVSTEISQAHIDPKAFLGQNGNTTLMERMARGGFSFGEIINRGRIGFGGGSYYMRTFFNRGIHEVLPGQDLWYGDLDNHQGGEIQSQIPYLIDHSLDEREDSFQFGKIRTAEALTLKLNALENAAWCVNNSDIQSEDKVSVLGGFFEATEDMNLPGTWEFVVGELSCFSHVRAPHLKLTADSLKIGDNGRNPRNHPRTEEERWGFIEATDGILDVLVKGVRLPPKRVNFCDCGNPTCKDKHGSFATGSLVPFENTCGKMFGKTGVKIVLEKGDMTNGEAINVENGLKSGKLKPGIYEFIITKNGAGIGSNGLIDISVQEGNLQNNFGIIYTPGPFNIKVSRELTNTSGLIRSGTQGNIKAQKVTVDRVTSGWASSSVVDGGRTWHWVVSDEGIIDVDKETGGASGNLTLDCPDIIVNGSSILATGKLWSVFHKKYIVGGQEKLSGFQALDLPGMVDSAYFRALRRPSNWIDVSSLPRQFFPGKFFGLEGARVQAGFAKITGSGGGRYVHLDLTSLLLEGLGISHHNDYPAVSLIFDLVALSKAKVTPQGMIQDVGNKEKGETSLKPGMPFEEEEQPDKDDLVFLKKKPKNPNQARFAASPWVLNFMLREMCHHIMGAEAALNPHIFKRFHANAVAIGKKVINPEDLDALLEAFICYKGVEVYHDSYELVDKRRRIQNASSNPLSQDVEPTTAIVEELHPMLVVPPAAQNTKVEGNGALTDLNKDGQGIKINVDDDAVFKNGYVKGKNIKAAVGSLWAETVAKVIDCWDAGFTTHTIQEVAGQRMTFIATGEGEDDAIEFDVQKGNSVRIGVDTESGRGGTHFKAPNGSSVDAPVRTRFVERSSQGDKETHETRTDNHSSRHKTKGKYTDTAQRVDYYATDVESGIEIHIQGLNGVGIWDVQNERSYSSQETRYGGGLFGGVKTHVHQEASSTSQGGRMKAPITRIINVLGNTGIYLVGVDLRETQNLFLECENSPIYCLAGRNSYKTIDFTHSANPLWQSQELDSHSYLGFNPTQLNPTGTFHIKSNHAVIVEKVLGQSLDWVEPFRDQLEKSGGKIDLRELQEVYTHDHMEKDGPTAALMMMVAMAMTICTAGAASSAGMAVASSAGMTTAAGGLTAAGLVTQAVTAAAISSLSSSAISALVMNGGNVDKALKDFLKSDTIKAVLTSAATKGLDLGVGSVMSQVMVGLIKKQKLEDIFKTIAVDQASKGIAAYVGQGDLDKFIPREMAQGLGGAAIGALSSKNRESGAVDGLLAALSGLAFNSLFQDPNQVGKDAAGRAKREKVSLDKALDQEVAEAKKDSMAKAKLATAAVALFAERDIAVADKAVSNILEHSCNNALKALAMVSPEFQQALREEEAARNTQSPSAVPAPSAATRKRQTKPPVEAVPEEEHKESREEKQQPKARQQQEIEQGDPKEMLDQLDQMLQGLDGVQDGLTGASFGASGFKTKDSADVVIEDPDTDDEAEESSCGRIWRGIKGDFQKIAEFTGADKAMEKLAEKTKMTPEQLQQQQEAWEGCRFHPDAGADPREIAAGADTPGKAIDLVLRYGHITDKGTARAVGNAFNEALPFVPVAAGLGKALSKVAMKGAAKELGKKLGKPGANAHSFSVGDLAAGEEQLRKAAANLKRNPIGSLAQRMPLPKTANTNLVEVIAQRSKATGTHGPDPSFAPRMMAKDDLYLHRGSDGLGRSEGLGGPSASGAGLGRDAPRPSAPKPAVNPQGEAPKKAVRFADEGASAPTQRELHEVANPGRIQSRINIREGEGTNKSPGWKNAWRKHGDTAQPNKSQFTISEIEAKGILQNDVVINSPVKFDPLSGSYVREVDIGKVIGKLPIEKGAEATSKVTVFTDRFGNLVNLYPGPFKY